MLTHQSKLEISEPEELIDTIIEANYSRAKDMAVFEDNNGEAWSKETIKEIEKEYLPIITEIRDEVFQDTEILTYKQKRKLTDTAKLALSRAVGAAGFTGIVITGYGDDDYYPALSSFEAYGNIGGRVRFIWNKYKSVHVNDETNAAIVPIWFLFPGGI